jgi:hypothetical protein
LKWVATHVQFRVGKSNFREKFDRPAPGVPFCQILVGPKRFHQVLSDSQHRIQRASRILKNQANLPASDALPLPSSKRSKVPSLEQDIAGFHPPAAIHQAEQRERERRLAAAGFTDQGKDLARCYLKRYLTNRVDRPLRRLVGDLQASNIEQRRDVHGLAFLRVFESLGLVQK